MSWASKRQATVAKSTAEAEYVALSYATQEAVWLRQLMKDVGLDATSPTVIYEDTTERNTSTSIITLFGSVLGQRKSTLSIAPLRTWLQICLPRAYLECSLRNLETCLACAMWLEQIGYLLHGLLFELYNSQVGVFEYDSYTNNT